MKPNRIVSLMLAAALSAALLAGCSRGRNAAAETQSTPLIAPTAPAVTAMPDHTAAPAQGGQSARDGVSAATPMDWLRHAGDVEDRIRMFSEIESASIVVDGSVALVGVTFDGAYQGQLTQRIRDMVAGEVQAADPGVQTVGVTNDAEDVAAIQTLAAQIRTGASPQDLSQRVNAILTDDTTMK